MLMRVVNNTSPLMNLAAIGKQHLLRELFSEVMAPIAVVEELEAGATGAPGRDARHWTWLKLLSAKNLDAVRALNLQLDVGESHAIAVALEIKPDFVLLDEKLARAAAAAMGLTPLGTIGVVLLAKQKGLVQEVRPLFDQLRSRAGFWINEAVYNAALRTAKELEV